MKQEKINKFHKELETLIGEKIPKFVSRQILESIPKENNRTDENAQYTYLNRVYTFGEYRSILYLYDKKYESKLHQKGVKEELLFSYRPITPGLLKDHRIRNNRGLFEHVSEEIKPSKITDKNYNIFVIKKTSWDSNLYEGYHYEYTIYGFKADMKFINKQQAESQLVINKLKKDLNIKSLDESEADVSE